MKTEKFERKLTAILSADVKGYRRLMRADEDATVRTVTEWGIIIFTTIMMGIGVVIIYRRRIA